MHSAEWLNQTIILKPTGLQKGIHVQSDLSTYMNQITITSLYGHFLSLDKKATIHQLTTMLAISENVLFPGHNHPVNHRY